MSGTRLKSHSPLLCGQINTYFPHSDHGSCRCGQCFISVQSLGVAVSQLQQGISKIELRLSIFWLANLITISLGEHQHISYPFILEGSLIPFLFPLPPLSKNKFTWLTKSEAWTDRCISFWSYTGSLTSGWVKFKTDFVINTLLCIKVPFQCHDITQLSGFPTTVWTAYLPEGCPCTS